MRAIPLAKKSGFEELRLRLEEHREKAKKRFQIDFPEAASWLKQRKLDLGELRYHSQRLLTGASLSTALLLAAPTSPKALPQKSVQVRLAQAGIEPLSQTKISFAGKLNPFVPSPIGHLDEEDEVAVRGLLKETYGITAASSFEGQRLNHSLGWIGFEQHLPRFPGDHLGSHEDELGAGMTSGLGAWGYFAPQESELTPELKQTEKYYVAVQTLYLPHWETDLKFLREWYKYRKVVVVNIQNGSTVIAAIADSGPAAWTGKQFGGSPEVMRALDLTGKASKGKVLVYFVDDPGNKVPLGPVMGKIGDEVKLT